MTYECAGCGAAVENRESATLWMTTPLGLSTLRACPSQECARLAIERAPAGWRLRPGNLPPFRDADERVAHVAAREARRLQSVEPTG